MIILDTNVISEILRPEPGESVASWFNSQQRRQLFTTSVTQAEILYGLALLPRGARREKLLAAAQLIFEEELENHVLPFGSEAAGIFAEIGAARRSSGRPISQFDAMIAGIARLHDAKIATRNISDFDDCGIQLINPWANK
jgi:predicted nucleic acid-binding protein